MYKKLERELTAYAESLVDEVNDKGDTLYVPIINRPRQVEFLEYAKKNQSAVALYNNAAYWFDSYVYVVKNTFTGKMGGHKKTTLYWRLKPEFKETDGGSYLYFRAYIDDI